MCKRTQHVTSNNVGSCWSTMLRPFARSLTGLWRTFAIEVPKKWLRSHLSKVFLHETIEARISQLTDSLFSFSRSLSARRKKKKEGFIYRKRKVWSVGGGRGFKIKNVCGEARPTFTFADNPVLYRKRSIKRRFSNKRRTCTENNFISAALEYVLRR